MHEFDVLGDPVRRRILELLADGEWTSGEVYAVIREEFGISQPAVDGWLDHFRRLWTQSLEALAAELALERGQRLLEQPDDRGDEE